MSRVVWAKLISFEPQPQIYKNYNCADIQSMQKVMLKFSQSSTNVWRTELVSIAEQLTPSKICVLWRLVHLLLVSLAACFPTLLSCQTDMDGTLLNYMCLAVCGLLEFHAWCSSVGCNSQCFSGDIPVWGSFNSVFPVCPASTFWVAQWYSSVHWVNQRHSMYTWPASLHWLRVRGPKTLLRYP